jgi:hypothetical protein
MKITAIVEYIYDVDFSSLHGLHLLYKLSLLPFVHWKQKTIEFWNVKVQCMCWWWCCMWCINGNTINQRILGPITVTQPTSETIITQQPIVQSMFLTRTFYVKYIEKFFFNKWMVLISELENFFVLPSQKMFLDYDRSLTSRGSTQTNVFLWTNDINYKSWNYN